MAEMTRAVHAAMRDAILSSTIPSSVSRRLCSAKRRDSRTRSRLGSEETRTKTLRQEPPGPSYRVAEQSIQALRHLWPAARFHRRRRPRSEASHSTNQAFNAQCRSSAPARAHPGKAGTRTSRIRSMRSSRKRYRTEPDFYFATTAKDCRIEAIVTKDGAVNELPRGRGRRNRSRSHSCFTPNRADKFPTSARFGTTSTRCSLPTCAARIIRSPA